MIFSDAYNPPEEQFLPDMFKEDENDSFHPCDRMLFQGENSKIMTFLLNHGYAGNVDLVYIDPPFATNKVFTLGEDRVSTVSSCGSDRKAYADRLSGKDYLDFLRIRLILLRELLSEQGSIYLHIDYKIGHYVKILMDEVFGIKNFRNDITRIKCNPKNFARISYGNIKDLILFYSKGAHPIWNDSRESLDIQEISSRFRQIDSHGRRYTTVPLHAPGETRNGPTGGEWRGIRPPVGRHWRCDPRKLDELDAAGLIEWSKTGNPRRIIYAEDRISQGKKIQDVWTYKDPQYPVYPTEKNLEMLKLIVQTSSLPGSLVLDCFSGSGTTLAAAGELKRNWIGIDQSDAAIQVCQKRLRSQMPFRTYTFPAEKPVEI